MVSAFRSKCSAKVVRLILDNPFQRRRGAIGPPEPQVCERELESGAHERRIQGERAFERACRRIEASGAAEQVSLEKCDLGHIGIEPFCALEGREGGGHVAGFR